MFSLLYKEVSAFFSTLTGYVVICVFLVVNSLFMWVFKSDLNVLENGYANLDALFFLAPWIFFFLVPAITMRLFSEERRSGTIELLLTLPLTDLRIILAKYLAALLLVMASLIPTLVYYTSVYLLGNPQGNLDSGGIIGSYLGLLFLSGVYAAVGLFISSLTDNLIISFIITVLICFLLYTGFDLLASLDLFGRAGHFIMKLGINEHYISIRRGVLDTRDLIYFLSLIAIFLLLTRFFLREPSRSTVLRLPLNLMVILLVNIISSLFFHRIDMTSEKRYSVSPAAREILKGLDDVAYFRVYLDGELPAGFSRFSAAIRETLDEFRVYAGENLQYGFIDPARDPDPQIRQNVFGQLVEAGLQPTNVQVRQKDGSTMQKIMFPGLIISYSGIEVPVNLLKNNMALSGEVNLQNSIQSLEYELIIMLRNLNGKKIEKVAFLEGHGELDFFQVADITRTLANFYQVDTGAVSGRPGILG